MAIKNKVSELKSRSDEMIDFIKNVPYSKVNNYIDQHVTDLQSAKVFLKKITKVLIYLIKEM